MELIINIIMSYIRIVLISGQSSCSVQRSLRPVANAGHGRAADYTTEGAVCQ